MVLTPSTMVELGTRAPDFTLPDVDGRPVSRSDFAGEPLLVAFICNHCPFVIHLRDHLVETIHGYGERGLRAVAISSNSTETHPQDGPEKMRELASEAGFTFPYLFDEDQEVAKAYRAACTPDFFLYDSDHRLVYRGRYDASRPEQGEPTGEDLIAAIEALLAGESVPGDQKNSVGCNIKWKPGHEPDYFSKG